MNNLAQNLWQANQDLAMACLNCDFVQGIATGTLPQSKFQYYVGQDAFFLQAFAKAYSIIGAKTEVWQDFLVFNQLATGVLEELTLHQSYALQWGVNLDQIKPAPSTQRYTDFLLATAWSRPVGITTAAMTPCLRLYAFLGQSLAAKGIPNHLYKDWISTYSSPEFESLTIQLETLLNLYGAEGPVADAYNYAMQCELEFFEAAWKI